MELEHQLQSDIARLLELIRATNSALEDLRKAGKTNESLVVRQERLLHQKYTTELDQIMKKFKLSVHTIEE